MTTTPSPATASTPPLIQRLAAGDCLWVIVTDTEVQSLLRAGHAYIAATLPHRSEMVTLAITEEGRSAAYTQRAFFRALDNAEIKHSADSTTGIKFMVGTQEVTGYAEDFFEVRPLDGPLAAPRPFKAGDKVRIARRVETDSKGRDCDWVHNMDAIIGRTGRIRSLCDDGMVSVDMDEGVGYDFSPEALDIIAD